MDLIVKDPKDDIDFSKGVKITLKGNGDFRSTECIDLLEQSDMVVTNPPFSSARAYVAELEKYDKKFIIIGDLNWITYKEIFPLIKENKLWLGYTKVKEFKQPDGTYKKFGNKLWFTNVDTKKRHHKLETVYRWRKRKEKYPDLYPKYDNYDAIEVGKVLQIPLDYDEIMGVPITFLDVYNPDQFEVLGLTTGRKEFSKESWPTKRYINALQHKSNGQIVNGSKANTRATIAVDNPKGTYYTSDNSNKKLEIKYARILIRNKHPEDYQNDL